MTGKWVKDQRSAMHLTRPKMALLLGYSANYIYLVETDRKPLSDDLVRKVSELSKNFPASLAKSAPYPKLKSSDMEHAAPWQVRDREAPAPQQCHYPENCDMRTELDKLNAKVDTLIQLLSGRLALSGENKKEKAG